MRLFSRKKRSEQKQQVVIFAPPEKAEWMYDGYTKLADSPEVRIAIDRIADLISSMSIHLMKNGEKGDIRVKNSLSRVVDIEPNQYMTRKAFLTWLVRTLLIEGNGNAVVLPITQRGKLVELRPIPAKNVSFLIEDYSYQIEIDGKVYEPSQVLHFTVNNQAYQPFMGSGYKVALKDLVENLKQSYATKKSFMSSNYLPSVIVSVDSNSGELEDEEGRQIIEDRYLTRKEKNKPWIIPDGLIKVEQIRPLTLNDLALNDAVTLDKKTVAAILGIPGFLLGVDKYNKEEYNSFINTRILSIAQSIQQTLNKLLIAEDEYFSFNPRSLYNYSMKELVDAGVSMVKVNSLRRNELRNWLGIPPDEEMNDLLVLENFLYQEDLGKQGKLKGGEDE